MRIGPGRQEIEADGVVAGIGLQPNVELAESAGLTISNGIVVDRCLRTSHPTSTRRATSPTSTIPPWQRASASSTRTTPTPWAGGRPAWPDEADAYHHLPSFYSDLFDLGFEAVGDLDARLETVADWKEPYRKGVVYYLRKAGCAGSCCGTSGSRWTPRGV